MRAELDAVQEDTDQADVDNAIAWAANLPEDVTNDYQWNIRLLAGQETIKARSFGLALSILASYLREQNKEAEVARKESTRKPSNWVGTVGKRQNWTGLTLEFMTTTSSEWGCSTLLKFVDQDGNQFACFSTGDKTNEYTLNTTYNLKATVKDHKLYKGTKQTQLTRIANVQEVQAPAQLLLEAPSTPDTPVADVLEVL